MKRIPIFYPLDWPAGKPRTSEYNKAYGRYRNGHREVTFAEAQARVFIALNAFNGQGHGDVVEVNNPDCCELRCMLEINKDGTSFRRGQKTPPDKGVVVFFEIDGSPITIAIDKFTSIEQNTAACAAAIDSLRQLWRVDAGTFLAAASGLNALPHIAVPNWRGILGYKQEENPTYDEVKHRYRVMASAAHSDKGGNDNVMADLNRAWSDAKEEFKQ